MTGFFILLLLITDKKSKISEKKRYYSVVHSGYVAKVTQRAISADRI